MAEKSLVEPSPPPVPPLPIPLPYASEPRFASALWAWKDLVTFLY